MFLISVAFGRGWCDFGPLDEEGSPYQIFADDDRNDDGDSDDDDNDGHDDKFHLIRMTRNGTGIKVTNSLHYTFMKINVVLTKDDEMSDKKKAEKKQKKAEKRGVISILTKKGKLKDYTQPNDEEGVCRLCFLIGCAYGRGLLDELGPFEGGGRYEMLEEGFDLVE